MNMAWGKPSQKTTNAPARALVRRLQRGEDDGAGNHARTDQLAARAEPPGRRPVATAAIGAVVSEFPPKRWLRCSCQRSSKASSNYAPPGGADQGIPRLHRRHQHLADQLTRTFGGARVWIIPTRL